MGHKYSLQRIGTVTAVLLGVALAARAGEQVVIDAILARVNDRILTVSDFRSRMMADLSQLGDQPEGQDLRQFGAQLFETAIEEMVLLERAQEKELTIEDSMVDRAIDQLREDNDLQDDAVFEEAIAQAGLSEEKLRDRYRQNMLLQRAVQSEIEPTEVTEEELRAVYEDEKERFKIPKKVELEQIFFPDEDQSADLKRRVKALVDRVRGGTDLIAEATLAGVEVSDVGAIPVDDLRPSLKEVIADLDEGELSEPIESGGGYLLVRLVKRIPARYQEFDDVKESLRRRESARSYQEQSQGLVSKLMSDYLVEIHRDRLDLVFNGEVDGE